MQSEQINELAAALAKAQGAMSNAKFDKENPHFHSRYATLAAVYDAIRAPLSANGLSTSQTTEARENGDFGLVTTLMHASGQYRSSWYPLPVSARPQEMGSALTYGRRYSLAAIVGISADEDDDGNAAQAQERKVEEKPPVAAGPNYVAMGGAIVIALEACKSKEEVERLEGLNAETMAELEAKAPRVAARVKEHFEEALRKLAKPPDQTHAEFLTDLEIEMTACKTRKGLDLVWKNNETAIAKLGESDFVAASKLYEYQIDRVKK